MSEINPQYDELLNIKYYGAKGDGSTDDTQALNDVVDAALSSEGGGHVFIPHGRFAVNPEVAGAALTRVGINGLTIRGVNKYSSVLTLLDPDQEGAILAFVDCDDIQIHDLGFDGGVTTGTRVPWNRAIDARGVQGLSMDNIHTQHTGNSAIRVATKGLPGSDAIPHGTRPSTDVFLTNSRVDTAYGSGGILTKSGGANRIHIIDNFFIGSGIQAISLESEDPVDGVTDNFHGEHIVSGNTIRDTDVLGAGAAFTGYGLTIQEFSHRQVISDNTFVNIGGVSAIDLTTSSTQSDTPVEETLIHGNFINGVTVGSRKSGISLRSGDADITNVSILDNEVYNAQYGVQFYPQTQTTTLGVIRDVKISDNRFEGCDIGVWYNNVDGNAAAKLPVEDIQITDNKIECRILGIQLLVKGLQASDNRILRTPGTTGYTHAIGIRAGSSDLSIYDNVVPDMTAEGSTIPPVRLNGEFSYRQDGEFYFWVDTSGRLRIADLTTTPTVLNRDILGTVVGSQV